METLKQTNPNLKKQPEWLDDAKELARSQIESFVNNEGLKSIASEFDPEFAKIEDEDEKLDKLQKIAADNWDFRKGRERQEVVETIDIDNPDSSIYHRINEGAVNMGMVGSSKPKSEYYDLIAIPGGANNSPYNRMRYALEQGVDYDMLVFLGSERAINDVEKAKVAHYAEDAESEFDLGTGAISKLLGEEVKDDDVFHVRDKAWRVAYFEHKNPEDSRSAFVISAPARVGAKRANTGDTYDFMRLLARDDLGPGKKVLLSTNAHFRPFQHFDAVRELTLKTGSEVETIAFEAGYNDMAEKKPSEILQETKSAIDAAAKLRQAINSL